MAVRGIGYFDSKGQYFRTPQEATLSDLAGLLGRMGEGDSLAPGIAKILFEKRREIEHIFRDHDDMVNGGPLPEGHDEPEAEMPSNVRQFSPARTGERA